MTFLKLFFFVVKNYTLTRCDGSYKIGKQIFVNFKQMIQPCDCTLQTSFSGKLLVTARSDGYHECRNKVTVRTDAKNEDFYCGRKYTSANTFIVVKYKTVVNVKAMCTVRYSSWDLHICKLIRTVP